MIQIIIALIVIVPAVLVVYLLAWDTKKSKHLTTVTLNDVSKECPGWGWFLTPGFSIIICVICLGSLLYDWLKEKPIL